MEELVKRKTCFVLKPDAYEISCDKCGGINITWSEYEHKIWCYDCQIDTDGNPGIFDGPIPVSVTKLLLGEHCFDQINIETGEIIPDKERK